MGNGRRMNGCRLSSGSGSGLSSGSSSGLGGGLQCCRGRLHLLSCLGKQLWVRLHVRKHRLHTCSATKARGERRR